jgi:hypothetical protein
LISTDPKQPDGGVYAHAEVVEIHADKAKAPAINCKRRFDVLSRLFTPLHIRLSPF